MTLFTLRRATLLSLGLVVMFGCKKENLKQFNKPTDPVLKHILDLGFAREDIREFKDYYLVEGDIRFMKNQSPPTKQAHAGSLISYANRNVTVFLDISSFSGLTFQSRINNAFNNALNAYAGISFTCIDLSSTGSAGSADIVIKSGNLPTDVCGEGEFPVSGNAGPEVIIDQGEVGSHTEAQLTFLLIHELGHNIGLRHTDWSSAGESTAVHIDATPNSDANSVMNSGTCGYSFSALSSMDERAIQVLYPEIRYAAWGTGLGSAGSIRTGDFNADGRTDMLQIASGNSHVWLSSGSALVNSGTWGTGHGTFAETRVADFNGDGKADLAQFASSGNSYVWFSTGSGFSAQGLWGTGHGAASGLLLADLNADGKKDVIQIASGNSYVWLSSGSGFTYQGLWGTGHGTINQLRVIDFNADGREDLIQVSAVGNSYVWTSSGTGFTYLGLTGSGHGSIGNIFTGDFNNDSRVDLMQVSSGNAHVWLSNGSSFVSSGTWATGVGLASEIKVLDMNGDGSDDIIQIYEGASFRWLSTGSAFGSYRFWSSGHGFASENFVGTFNSGATVDIIQVSTSGNAYFWSSF